MKKLFFIIVCLFFGTIGFSQQNTANIKIMLTDADSIAEANALIKIYSTDKTYKFEGNTDDLGFLKVKLPMGKELHLDVYRYDTVFNFIQTIPPGNYGGFEIPFLMQVHLYKSFVETYYLPVLFESNKYEITENNKSSIDALFKTMSDSSEMQIEIGAHTDNVGSDTYNQQLSQKRAASIRAYLVEKGIEGERITAKGYGETKPVGDNNTEEGKAKNRRVEIKVMATK